VGNLNNASFFRLLDTFLVDISDGGYLGVKTSMTSSLLRKFQNQSLATSGWSKDQSNEVSLFGSNFTLGGGEALFCALPNSSVVVGAQELPPDCRTAELAAEMSEAVRKVCGSC
jgi:hypothetical protein